MSRTGTSAISAWSACARIRRATGSFGYPFPVSVKTGTAKGYRDVWCVAYSDTYIAGVRVGHPDNYPMKKRTGADSAAQLVHGIMETLHPHRMDGMGETAFPPPPGYVARRICMLSGKLATDETQHLALEWFKPGTEPVEKSDVYRKVVIDARTGRLALPDSAALQSTSAESHPFRQDERSRHGPNPGDPLVLR
ncbi:MAG: hypothetical protein HYX75_08760 [Acidobacteria bacterium]|nr:hypothetical protein [Acidobacteriota bacterium]